ncbi:hypothetical protein HDV05_000141 [Chytridiales sp. JEL 0842]|nr:hypothetical protein HDV05_000141 [Chytridiales sp. JEL 0842]
MNYLDVLDNTLQLMVRQAQRVSRGRAVKQSPLTPVREQILTLAQNWGFGVQGGLDATSLEMVDSDSAATASVEPLEFIYQFYKNRSKDSGNVAVSSSSNPPPLGTPPAAAVAPMMEITPSASQTPIATPVKPGVSFSPFATPVNSALIKAETISDSMTVINIPDLSMAGKSAEELSFVPEDIVQSKIFLYEPDLARKLSDLLQSNSKSSIVLQTAALYALEGMLKHRSHVTEVLTALNASANHGLLMFLIRKLLRSLETDESVDEVTGDFTDALLSLVMQILTSIQGGNMLISAGLVQSFVNVIQIKHAAHLKTITKFVSILDSILYQYQNAVASFESAQGVDVFVKRIKEEVEDCVSMKSAMVEDKVGQSSSSEKEVPTEKAAFLRALLKFVLHMMQTTGSLDQMRNLIETSLPTSLLIIFQDASFFGAGIFGIAVNIMSTFIHNEPTSLSILQESNLPQTFLTVAAGDKMPISAEVISALPNAFGAICLNPPGLQAFNSANPMARFFKILVDDEHIRCIQDKDVPHLIGSSIDELIRHHPTLKDSIMSEILNMVKHVLEVGNTIREDEIDIVSLHVGKPGNDTEAKSDDDELSKKEKKETKTSVLVDVISRFLEGLFQNVSQNKEFVKIGGAEVLLKFYSLRMLPYDTTASPNSFTLSFLVKLLLEVNYQAVAPLFIRELDVALRAALELFTKESTDSWSMALIDLQEGKQDLIAEAEKVYTILVPLLGLLRLLADTLGSSNVSQSKSFSILMSLFNGATGESLLPTLGRLHRLAVVENMRLKSSVPKSWCETKPKKPQTQGYSETPAAATFPAENLANGIVTEKDTETDDFTVARDYRVHNTAFFRHVLTEIPMLLNQLYGGVLRICSNRRIAELSRPCILHVTDSIAQFCKENLASKDVAPNIDRLGYLSFSLGTIATLMIDDQLHMSLHTSLVSAYLGSGLVDVLLEVCDGLWTESDSLKSSSMETEDNAELQKKLYGLLDLCFAILTSLTDSQAVHSSPYTANFIAKDKDRTTTTENFDPNEFVVKMRVKIFPFIEKVWASDFMKRCPTNIGQAVITILIQILKASGEVAQQKPAATSSNSIASALGQSLFGRPFPTYQPDEEKIQQLVDMGYPRGAAEVALQRTGNNVARAVDYLITHPSVVASSMFSSSLNTNTNASGSSAATAASAATTSTLATASEPPSATAPSGALSGSGTAATAETAQSAGEETDELALALAMSMAPLDPSTSGETSAVPMETDQSTPAPPANETEAPKVAASEDKGKAKAEAPEEGFLNVQKRDLDKNRAEFRKLLVSRAMEILISLENVVHNIRDLLKLLPVEELRTALTGQFRKIEASLQQDRASLSSEKLTEMDRQQSTLFHFLTLILTTNEERQNDQFVEAVKPLDSVLLNSLVNIENFRVEGLYPSWLCSGLLFLDSLFVLADEPAIDTLPVEAKEASTENSSIPAKLRPIQFSFDDRKRLVQALVKVLREKLDDNTLHSALRLSVRLTRNHALAIDFANSDGVKELLKAEKLSLFPAQLTLTYLLLRHIVESHQILKGFMEDEVKAWCGNQGRHFDIFSLFKSKPYLAGRDPTAFVQVVTENCYFDRFNPSDKNEDRLLAWRDVTGDMEHVKPVDGPHVNTASEAVLAYLLSELVNLKSTLPVVSFKEDMEVAAAAKNEHIRRAFILRCIGDLVYAFPSCRIELVNISQRKPAKITPHKTPRNPLLSHLLNDLIPFDIDEDCKKDDSIKLRLVECECAAFLIYALCSDLPARYKDNAEHATARKAIVDSLNRAFKDAVNSTDHVDVKYCKISSLADLCYWILTNGKGDAPIPGGPTYDGSSTSMQKIMIEKGLVNSLTLALADIDPNYSKANEVIVRILKPYEHLSKVAFKMARSASAASEVKEDSTKQTSEDSAAVEQMDLVDQDEDLYTDEMHTEEQSAISDIYRNSSLGMFNARETDDEDDDHDEDDDLDDAEEDFDDFDEDDYSGDEMLEDEEEEDESDMEDDMEIVVPNPYHGAEEEDEEMDSTDDDDGGDDANDMVWNDVGGEDEGENDEEGVHAGDEFDDNEEEEDEDDGEENDDNDGEDEFGPLHDDEDSGDDDEDGVDMGEQDADFSVEVDAFGQDLDMGGAFDRRRPRGDFFGLDLNRDGHLELRWNAGQGNGARQRNSGREWLADRSPFDTVDTHPLLANSSDSPRDQRVSAFNSNLRGRGGAHHLVPPPSAGLEVLSELFGSNAASLLQAVRGGRARVEVPALPIGQGIVDLSGMSAAGGLSALLANALSGGGPPPGAVSRQISMLDADEAEASATTVNSSTNDNINNLLSEPPMTTADRWLQESRLLYDRYTETFARRTMNSILAVLLPAAIEQKKKDDAIAAEKKAKEEEQRLKKEQEAKAKAEAEAAEAARKAEAERQAVAEAAAAASSSSAVNTTTANEEGGSSTTDTAVSDAVATGDDSMETETQQTEADRPRVIVELNGQQVDITDSGIDPEFLAALPDDLREEVINQHLREQRQRTRAAPSETINPDLSDFLDALPADMREEVLIQQRVVPIATQNADPSSFLAALEPALQQGGLIGRGHDILGQLGGDFRDPLIGRRGLRAGRSIANAPLLSAAAKRTNAVDAIQLVDKQGLMTVLRQLFIPEVPNKTIVNRLLLNLSENSRTKIEIISALLSVLVDGKADIGAFDRSFSQLSIKNKLKQTSTPKKASMASVSAGSSLLAFSGPQHLLTERAIESLTFLITNSPKVSKFMISENETFAQTFGKSKTPKKGKGKEKATISNYPVVILMQLLERQSFLSNATLLEQLVHLISTTLKPLATMKATATLVNSADTSAADSGRQERPNVAGAEGESTATAVDAPSGSSSTPKASDVPSSAEPKVPVIPEHCVRSVVHILTTGDCSVKTFQFTLSIIQYLSTFKNNRLVITSELVHSAQGIADSMLVDVAEVFSALGTTGSNVDVNSGPFAKFIASTSQQAKLLRVLKTIDFIYSKLTSKTTSKPLDPKLANETRQGGTAESASSSASTSANAEADRLDQNGLSLAAIYDQLSLKQLWTKLGGVLESIATRDHLVQIGTLLLPLIESFMVVSKPYVSPRTTATRQVPSAANTISSVRKDIDEMSLEELFFVFTEDHRKVLNTMVRNNPSLMSGSFSLLVENPKVLEFDNKRTYFTQQLHKRGSREQYGALHINVRRSHVFEDSYHQLQGRSGDEIKNSKLNVRFYEEEGVDAGGVTREWFSVLARQMFNPDYALFKPSAVDKVTYQPNRTSFINPDHLLFFRFVGRIIGKAIHDGRLLDCYFTRSFYKCMLDIPVDWKDMEAIDPEFHKSLEWMLQNDITDVIDLTFSTEVDDFGRKKIIDLKPNGHSIPVTEENKKEYVALITEQKLTTAIKDQINAFLGGFYEIIPRDLIKIFNEQEMELLISGLPDIDVDDWKNNTEYHNYSMTSPQIQWFWRAVRSFSQEERAKIIQFVTGTSRVPLEGFKALEGSHGVQKFNIHKEFSTSDNRLPSAHTCFNQLDLPEYSSYEILRNNLLLAVSECGTGFADANCDRISNCHPPPSLLTSNPSSSPAFQILCTMTSFYSFTVNNFAGKPFDLTALKGQVVLIVNVASQCGFSVQCMLIILLEFVKVLSLHINLDPGFEKLYKSHKDEGFTVLGFPTNDFKQEPLFGSKLVEACQRNYGVTFPIMEKCHVNGPDAHPLYEFIKAAKPGIMGIKRIKWNFEKNGNVVKRYPMFTKPEDIEPDIVQLLEGKSML